MRDLVSGVVWGGVGWYDVMCTAVVLVDALGVEPICATASPFAPQLRHRGEIDES